jgi:hypothetical protein
LWAEVIFHERSGLVVTPQSAVRVPARAYFTKVVRIDKTGVDSASRYTTFLRDVVILDRF